MLLIQYFCLSLNIKCGFLTRLRAIFFPFNSLQPHFLHTEASNTIPSPALISLTLPTRPGELCPSPPLTHFRKNPASHDNLSHKAVFSISFCLSHTNTRVSLTLLIVYFLPSTRQKLEFNYLIMWRPASSTQWQKSNFSKQGPASDACWLFYD